MVYNMLANALLGMLTSGVQKHQVNFCNSKSLDMPSVRLVVAMVAEFVSFNFHGPAMPFFGPMKNLECLH